MSKPLILYSKIADDPRVNVWHISLYTFILSLWHESGYQKQIRVSRKQLMKGAHFNSITTYHKCIGKLKELKYIIYLPTYDTYQGSTIELVL
ncbi:hypothetical protein Mucpa_6837 [Mucilaginibacter paludis DSM 18603]|uniref:Transcriptional regulator n=2 Tax=Mucilaginibacter TaxID=423349 RepID=H1Y1L2_9SPHI|nr:hypothetical protein Mucpa_6837 [Mucilaginibacter paludis DSM 18603]